MAFTAYPDPDHVKFPCPEGCELRERHEHWDPRGSHVDGLRKAGLPHDHPHHVEIDCSTGREGWTRFTLEEAAFWAFDAENDPALEGINLWRHNPGADPSKEAVALLEAQAQAKRVREADFALIGQLIDSDPRWAALIRQMGVKA